MPTVDTTLSKYWQTSVNTLAELEEQAVPKRTKEFKTDIGATLHLFTFYI